MTHLEMLEKLSIGDSVLIDLSKYGPSEHHLSTHKIVGFYSVDKNDKSIADNVNKLHSYQEFRSKNIMFITEKLRKANKVLGAIISPGIKINEQLFATAMAPEFLIKK